MSGFAGVDALVTDYQRRGGQPGLVYGIVRGGELVHVLGLGERRLGGAPPDADTVFRIASMTKSFTASAVLMLRDEGALALDDPAARYVPELGDWQPVTPGAAPVTIRHLLTMTAGFPTDDPWGDRQQGLPLDEFGRFLADGVRFAWEPGTRFEYSNLGYAILGRIIAAVTNTAYQDFIRDRFFGPLEMTRSGYEAADADPDQLAHGYRQAPASWQEMPLDPCGAFAPMGGVFTCVLDLSRWVAGFAAAFRGDSAVADDGHPLCRASRRQMQLPQVLTDWDRWAFPAAGARSAYGFGLLIEDDPDHGRIAGHGGGYPGFGSYMRWHPATGTGVIALANSTYARMATLTQRILAALLRDGTSMSGRAAVPLAPGREPWPETIAAREAVNQLLVSWDDQAADRLFSPNVALDTPYRERRDAIALVRARIGDFRQAPKAPEHDTPAHCRWWLAGERGVVQVQIQLTPERSPRVQSLALAVPPAPGSPLSDMTSAFVAWLNGGDAVSVHDGRDPSSLGRRVRAASAWLGKCRPGVYTAGDGEKTVTLSLVGQHARMTLSLTLNPATFELVAVELTRPD